ncbi:MULTISPECIES: DUF3631 domain-containing protein [unclassified Micromonospora]|uniref:DUF3631 domain-containing protein n=1 Tax=unclassified Micromonospora TaxID=2617518 RepID=UPI00351038EF
MRRRAPGETVAPYRHRRDGPALRTIAQRLGQWLGAHLSTLEAAEPPMPVEDRAADTWEPLVAVADLAGSTWPQRARQAVTVLTTEADESGNVSTRVRLLADVRTAFTVLGDPPAASTHDLLTALNGDEEAPWAGFGPTGLTGKRLGDLLREFGITSTTIRFPVGQAKGYTRDAFTDAWNRYCPAPAAGPSVPSVPTSFPQVIPGTDSLTGTDRSVPAPQSVPRLSRQNELGTDGTDTPRRHVTHRRP